MESSQESDISFHSVAASQDSVFSSQEDVVNEPGNESDGDIPMEDDTDGWTVIPQPVAVNNFDDSRTGPAHNLPDTASPLDFFKLFWTDYLTDLIVTETNR